MVYKTHLYTCVAMVIYNALEMTILQDEGHFSLSRYSGSDGFVGDQSIETLTTVSISRVVYL